MQGKTVTPHMGANIRGARLLRFYNITDLSLALDWSPVRVVEIEKRWNVEPKSLVEVARILGLDYAELRKSNYEERRLKDLLHIQYFEGKRLFACLCEMDHGIATFAHFLGISSMDLYRQFSLPKLPRETTMGLGQFLRDPNLRIFFEIVVPFYFVEVGDPHVPVGKRLAAARQDSCHATETFGDRTGLDSSILEEWESSSVLPLIVPLFLSNAYGASLRKMLEGTTLFYRQDGNKIVWDEFADPIRPKWPREGWRQSSWE